MSFIVEDGTGVPNANSYVSVSRAEEILSDLGYDEFPSESDLIKGSLYIDIVLDPSSFILTDEQGLLWPRKPFTDNQGREVSGIPYALERAVSVISAAFMNEDLFDIEPAIRSESYGKRSVEFASAVSLLPGEVVSQITYLKTLGYGRSSTSSVHLIRGD